jgi:hypothetical protein
MQKHRFTLTGLILSYSSLVSQYVKKFTMIQKFVFLTTIVLCLGLISCKEPNGPNIPPDEPEPLFDGPIVVIDDGAGDLYPQPTLSGYIVGSDLILVAKLSNVYNKYWEDNNHYNEVVEVEITEVLKGATNEKEATFIDGLYAPSKGEECIIFLRKDKAGDGFVLLTSGYGIWSAFWTKILQNGTTWHYSYEVLDDMKLLLNAYKKNKELFSKAGKQDLLNLYPQLRSVEIKGLFLDELVQSGHLDREDIPTLLKWRQAETRESFISTIEWLLNRLGWYGGEE